MKLNCGKTPETKRRERLEELHNQADCLREWHWKFALLPVKFDDYDCRWLEWYQVRFPSAYYWDGGVQGLHNMEIRSAEEANEEGEQH